MVLSQYMTILDGIDQYKLVPVLVLVLGGAGTGGQTDEQFIELLSLSTV